MDELPKHELELLWLASDGYFNRDEESAYRDKVDEVVDELYIGCAFSLQMKN